MGDEENLIISVAIVEDDYNYRTSIKELISLSSEMVCSVDYNNAEDFITYLKANQSIDVLLLDIGLPRMSGLDAITIIRQISSGTKILILTGQESEENIYKAIKMGVRGYLLKTASPFEIINTIERVNRGHIIYSIDMALNILKDFDDINRTSSTGNRYIPTLTKREREVLTMLGKGHSNKKIAEELFISINSVESHLTKIYKKLQVTNRIGAVDIAREAGIMIENNDLENEFLTTVFFFNQKGKPIRDIEFYFEFESDKNEVTKTSITDKHGKGITKHKSTGKACLIVDNMKIGKYTLPAEFAVML